MAKRKTKSTKGLSTCSYTIVTGTHRAFVGTERTLGAATARAKAFSLTHGTGAAVQCDRYPTRGSRRRTTRRRILICHKGTCSKWR